MKTNVIFRWGPVWQRNLLVWRKLSITSMLGNFGDPLLYLLGIGYGLGAFVGAVEGLDYLPFFAAGLVCASAMNTATFEGTYSAFTRMRMQGSWEAILATPLTVRDVVLGEAFWAATKGAFHAAIVLLVAWALGAADGVGALLALPVLFLAALVFGSIALCMTLIARSYDFFLYYFTLAVTPMFLFSGVFFPLGRLPEAAQIAANILPLSHVVNVIRPLTTDQPGAFALHLVVLAVYAAGFTALAVVMARRRIVV